MTPAEIKAIRQRYGLSQTELAALLRISDLRTVRRWEKGEVPVSGPASIILELMHSGELPQRYW
jgi:DNA-binding transcriptional regulator YiaG